MNTADRIHRLPVTQIVAGDNDRTMFRDEDLRELADSIAQDGLAQPITVRPLSLNVYEIVAGERRFRACCLLGWTTIPAIVRILTDEQASRIMLIENIHRKDIDPIDEANAYRKRMERFGWSAAQTAHMAKVSQKRVGARIALLELVPEAQNMIQQSQMGVQFGEVLSPLDHNRQRVAMRYLTSTDRPLLREFRAIVGRLLSEQAQESLFNTDLFIVQTLEAHQAERDDLHTRRFPVDESLPLMRRVGTIGLSFETYLAELLASDDLHHHQAALIVGRVYQSMLEGGLAYPPKRNATKP